MPSAMVLMGIVDCKDAKGGVYVLWVVPSERTREVTKFMDLVD